MNCFILRDPDRETVCVDGIHSRACPVERICARNPLPHRNDKPVKQRNTPFLRGLTREPNDEKHQESITMRQAGLIAAATLLAAALPLMTAPASAQGKGHGGGRAAVGATVGGGGGGASRSGGANVGGGVSDGR